MNKASFVSPSVEKETIESLSQKLLEANRQLSETNKELKRIQQERGEMLANISHAGSHNCDPQCTGLSAFRTGDLSGGLPDFSAAH